MLVTITQYRKLAIDANGNVLPLGGDRISGEELTLADDATALDPGARFVRIATDTPVQISGVGGTGDADLYLPGVEFIAVKGGETLTVATI